MITIDLEPVFEAERRWDRAVEELSNATRRAVDRAVKEGASEAIQTRQYTDDTGLLTSRIRGYVEVSVPGGAVGVIGALTDYASFVEGGTEPHEIRARNAPNLIFKARDGNWVVTKVVQHPGHPAFPFMGQAYLKAERVLIREIEVGIRDAQRIMDG